MIDDWLTYRPADFLLFSPEVYWRLFELQNRALWPLPLVALAVGGVIVAALLLRRRERVAWLAIGCGWIWTAYGFFWLRYQPVNWLAEYAAWAFAAEGAAIVAFAAAGRLRTREGRWAGLALLVWTIALHPLLPLLTGRPLIQAEIIGLAPDPTAIATLGLLLTVRSRLAGPLSVIPLMWLAASWLTLHTMGEVQHAVLPAAALVFLVGMALRSGARRQPPSGR